MDAVDFSGSPERSSGDGSAPGATVTARSPETSVEVSDISRNVKVVANGFLAGGDFTFCDKSRRSRVVTLSVDEHTGSLLIMNKDTG